MNEVTIGTCSLCGGPVKQATLDWSTVPSAPRCAQCHAVPAEAHGPIIPMRQSGFYGRGDNGVNANRFVGVDESFKLMFGAKPEPLQGEPEPERPKKPKPPRNIKRKRGSA